MPGKPPCDLEYVSPIRNDLRIRVQLWFADHRTETFAISLELEWGPDDWKRVVCIDNFGGRVHRDRYRPDGSDYAHHEPTFHSDDPDQAVAWATQDLTKRAPTYVTKFCKLAEEGA